jgi:putative PIG3 family NAD(P)H quinone oxidoreductase
MKEDEALIEIYAAGLNRADLLQRRGNYPSPPGCPEWMGLEIAGVIKRLGTEAAAKSKLKVGDKVCALLGGGGYAELVCVRYDLLMPAPQSLSMEEAAALPEAFATSYLNLYVEGNLKPGETAFIPAGASGLASAAIPMAKALGSRVITSVLSEEIAASIADLGSDIIIDGSKQKTPDILKEQMELGNPVNVAMDCLGGKDLGESLSYMAQGGCWVLISTLAGTETNIGLRPLLTKGIRLVGSMLRNKPLEMKARILKELVERVWPKIDAGEIKIKIYRALPVEQAEEAHAILERSENIGKVVLRVKK